MSNFDFDDLRNLTDDDEALEGVDGFTYDDLVEGDEFDLEMGQAIEDEEYEEARNAANEPFLGMSAMERMGLSVMLFLNILVLGYGMLIVTGRVG